MASTVSVALYQERIETYWKQRITTLGDDNPALRPMLAHHFKTCGKLLRPALTLACYHSLQGSPDANTPPHVLQAALAIELLHNATLVHDDLQDGDTHRRGIPTVWQAFSPYQAINAGSALYFYAQQQLVGLDVSADNRTQLMDVMVEQTLAIINGQAAEKDLWNTVARLSYPEAQQHYLRTVQGKTSALFAIPMLSAAILAQTDRSSLPVLRKVADPLGALFQIQDDLVDLYGSKGRDTAGADLAEGKPSYPALHFMFHANDTDAARLKALIQAERDDSDPADIAWAIEAIRTQGSLQASLAQIQRLYQDARAHIQQLPPAAHALQDLIEPMYQKIMQPIAHLL